jgi:chorismate-pyruvate lyase
MPRLPVNRLLLVFPPAYTPPVPSHHKTAELSALVGLFYQSPAELATFEQTAAEKLPDIYRRLLAHEHHMTVTVEEFHRSHVNVQVLEAKPSGNSYSRRILLSRQTDGGVVQFGIVRLNWDYFSPAVRHEIENQQAPLGRILIAHNVLRQIELVGLWRVQAGPDLARLFGMSPGDITYGRTAIIHCNGEPAVELLEIVTPAQ